MSSKVNPSSYVSHLDLRLAHHRAWLQQVLESYAKAAPGVLDRDGPHYHVWSSSVPLKPSPGADVLEPLLKLIRDGESRGSGDYEAVNHGSTGSGRRMAGLSDLSIREVMAAQDSGKIFAAGAYQITPPVMKELMQRAGLNPDQPFDKAAQDWLATVLVLGGWKRPKLTSYLLGKADSLFEAQWDIAHEWAALPLDASGAGAYDGFSGNKATIDPGALRAALEATRQAINGRSIKQLGLEPPAFKPPEKPVEAGMPKTTKEDGMTGPKMRAPMKPGDTYLLVNDNSNTVEAYDHENKLLWKKPCDAAGVNGRDWTRRNADTPPGLYKVGKIYRDYEKYGNMPSHTDELRAYGWYSFDMIELENQEAKHGRAGIMLHGGGGTWGNAWKPYQTLHLTNGCIRMRNADLRDFVLPRCEMGTVYIGVYQ